MSHEPVIRRADRLTASEVAALAELLAAVVDGGASVGFLPPLERDRAEAYWRGVERSGATLLLAEVDGVLAGTIQLQLAESENGAHRAEVCKLLVLPGFRRRGLGRALLAAVEAEAGRSGRSLLVLDTREGDPSNALYASAGWTEGGRIPSWARSASGALDGTVFWYRLLED
ncbi:MAG: N-acetyltransferase family protein [Chloroflexota bacterium]